jgi:hypothetical protein
VQLRIGPDRPAAVRDEQRGAVRARHTRPPPRRRGGSEPQVRRHHRRHTQGARRGHRQLSGHCPAGPASRTHVATYADNRVLECAAACPSPPGSRHRFGAWQRRR